MVYIIAVGHHLLSYCIYTCIYSLKKFVSLIFGTDTPTSYFNINNHTLPFNIAEVAINRSTM